MNFEPAYQKDLERYTASIVEANIERAILQSKRKYEIKYFNSNTNAKNHRNKLPVYFLTKKPDGVQTAYVLIAKPSKKTFAHQKQLEEQGIRVRLANEMFYTTLERLIAKRVEGWE